MPADVQHHPPMPFHQVFERLLVAHGEKTFEQLSVRHMPAPFGPPAPGSGAQPLLNRVCPSAPPPASPSEGFDAKPFERATRIPFRARSLGSLVAWGAAGSRRGRRDVSW